MLEEPRNIEAEEAVLGSLFCNPEAISKLSLAPEDFFVSRNGEIYRAIISLHRAKKTIEYISIVDQLEATNKLSEVGGVIYLMEIAGKSYTSLYAENYAEMILDASRRRSVIATARTLANVGYDKSGNVDAAISEAISQLANKANIQNGAVHISEYLSKLYDVVSERHDNPVKNGQVSGIPSGFIDFDNITDGFHAGEETILTAEPGLGKSLLAFQMACNMAKEFPGVVYELEMSALAVSKRQIASMANIATREMDRGTMEDENWTDFVTSIENASTLKLHISDDTRLTTATLRADLARLSETYGIRWFVLDYLALLKDSRGKDDIERTAWLSGELHGICKDLHLAGLVIHSMNKQGVRENNGNQADLSGSVRVIYDADQIIVMQHDKQFDNQVNLIWSKFREGEIPKGGMSLIKRQGLPAFANIKKMR
jgi:replicative DNA helicase